VLEQDVDRLELIISDNASDDGTEEICRQFARADARVRYHRQTHDIGLLANFNAVLARAEGTYFKWIGDDDWLAPSYVSRCAGILDDAPDLILVTTRQAHVGPDGTAVSARYDGGPLASSSPAERFTEMLRLVTDSHLLLDPLYGMMRRAVVASIPRPVMLFEDEVFAARLALAGPFGHVDEVLSSRGFRPFTRLPATARRLGVPVWHARVATSLQCLELLRAVREAGLPPGERHAARVATGRMFLRRRWRVVEHRSRKLAAVAARALARAPDPASAPGER
jgi:glycosyltransferase involved in cell wall biosynthesis